MSFHLVPMESQGSSAILLGLGVIIAYIVIRDTLFVSGLVSEPSLFVGSILGLQRLRAGLPYLLHGPQLIIDRYEKANGGSFIVQTPSNKHMFISSPEHIRELDLKSSKDISLHAAAKEILQPRLTYTDHQYEWPDRRGEDSLGFNRALRSLLTNNLANILPTIQQTLAREFDARIANCEKTNDGWIRFPVMANVRRTITVMNNVIFYGEAIAKREEVTEALLRYVDLVPALGELVKIVPAFIAALLTRNYRDYKLVHSALTPTIEERLRLRAAGEEPTEKPFDGLQWLIDTSPKHKNAWNVTRTVDEVISTWFSSVPQLSAVASFAVHDLSRYPEWQSRLLAELRGGGYDSFLKTAQGLPLMEAFIKESTRLSPIDGATCRRKVLSPVQFTNGLRIEVGDWVEVPQQAMWRDGKLFADPDKFEPMRFLKIASKPSGSNGENILPELKPELTEVSPTWVLWGYGRTACPGRFFVTFAIKLLLSHILLNYQIKTQEVESNRYFTWRSVIVPSGSMEILLKPN